MTALDLIREPSYFPEFCRRNVVIQTKSEGLRPFILNELQRAMWEVIGPSFSSAWGGFRRFVVLKTRQFGGTTFCQAINYWRTAYWEDVNSAAMAQDASTTFRIHLIFRLIHNNIPVPIRVGGRSTGQPAGFRFDYNRSSVRLFTAGAESAPRGSTFQFVHASELSQWKSADEAMLSLLQTVPSDGHIIVESTPYGIGNYFHRLWLDAQEGRAGWTPIFLPWFKVKEYRFQEYIHKDGGREQVVPNSEEAYYVEKYGLDQEQINWMRWARETNCAGDMDVFLQEYPFDDRSCFIASGRPFFDTKVLQSIDLEIRRKGEAVLVGDMITEGEDADYDFEECEDGLVRVYGVPQFDDGYGYRYVISADTCEGASSGEALVGDEDKKRKGDTDWNYCVVWDKITGCQVAVSRQRLDPDLFAELLFALMCWYGKGKTKGYYPLVIVERNSSGLAVLLKLMELFRQHSIPLMRLYHTGRMGIDYEPSTNELGFRTQGFGDSSRMVILSNLKEYIRENGSGIKSLEMIGEMMSFTKDNRGRPAAAAGRYDDAVMSQALVFEGLRRDLALYKLPVEEKKPEWIKRTFKQPGRKLLFPSGIIY